MIESNTRKELESKIDMYVEGRLSSEEIDELWVELIQDDYYYDYLKTVASLKGLAQSKKGKKSNIIELHTIRRWSVAAAIVLIAGTMALFNILQNGQTAIEPITSIELDYYRSAEGSVSESNTDQLVLQAITTANRGEVDQAIALLEEELIKLDDGDRKLELLVTAGSIHYNANQFEAAADKFEQGIEIESNNNSLKERNYWYLGNTYFQMNRIADARRVLEQAYELNGSYSRVAQSYLRALSE